MPLDHGTNRRVELNDMLHIHYSMQKVGPESGRQRGVADLA
jgi:hypothetical protein